MADDAPDQEDKTDFVSNRRLMQAWEEGRVPVARDLASVGGFGAAIATLVAVGPSLRASLVEVVAESARGMGAADGRSLLPHLTQPLMLGASVIGASALGALVATLAQTRGGVWTQLAMPDFSRLTQGGKISRLFKREFWVDLLISVAKVATIAAAAYFSLRGDFQKLRGLLQATTDTATASVFAALARAATKVLLAMAALAGIELAVTQFRFRDQLKMTKEEAKREMKEDAGDPLIRQRRRRRHRELAKGRASVEVPKADALVVNPTHVAVAIRYRADEGSSPRVTAKGKGKLAEIMRDLARENGVPIVQDIALARLLYRKVKVGGRIPAETYKAVAAVLAFVYRMTGRVKSR